MVIDTLPIISYHILTRYVDHSTAVHCYINEYIHQDCDQKYKKKKQQKKPLRTVESNTARVVSNRNQAYAPAQHHIPRFLIPLIIIVGGWTQ